MQLAADLRLDADKRESFILTRQCMGRGSDRLTVDKDVALMQRSCHLLLLILKCDSLFAVALGLSTFKRWDDPVCPLRPPICCETA